MRVAVSSLATGGWAAKVSAAADGNWSAPGLAPGRYRVSIVDNRDVYVDEWFHDAASAAAATVVTVTAGARTTVDESLTRATGASLPGREVDPVVITGAAVPSLAGRAPADIVAFRSTGTSWVQVPVQVDERHVADLKRLRDGSGTIGVTTLAYSDPGANAGADPTPTLDADDEIVVMGGDTGPRAPAGLAAPAGTQAATRVDLRVSDPRSAGAEAYVSLFVRSGTSLSPAAGADYVRYTLTLVSASSEDSNVQTDRYRTHFSARWTRDVVEIEAPYGTGADILDRHRTLFAPGVCDRSEDTFSAGPGGYATNKDGPVRAIRSYLGANSGTYTQREHLFYRAHEVVTTYLRVHQIPGIMDLWDSSAAATGMTYASNRAPGGVVVDGVPDTVASGALAWERLDGAQGALITAHSFQTTITGLAPTSYHLDDSTPPNTQCTGDSAEYGQSGTWINATIPNTDPAKPPASSLSSTRAIAYRTAGSSASTVATVVDQMNRPLTATVAP